MKSAEQDAAIVFGKDEDNLVIVAKTRQVQVTRSAPHEASNSDGSLVADALALADRRGRMSNGQYQYILEELGAVRSSALLVFGVGHDALLWWRATGGRAAFVEDNPKYLSLAPAEARVVLVKYATRVGVWCDDVRAPPPLVNRPWDFVLVDGPTGFDAHQPGRQFSIAWARRLATRAIFVHDYERPWERAICDRILGPTAKVIPSDGSKRGDMAIFDVAANWQ